MEKRVQVQNAEQLRLWHGGLEILVLPCAWDVASAKLFEHAGFKAVGTTSAGVAATLGCSDGQSMNFEEYVTIVRRIATHVHVPVSVDIESGYGATIEVIVDNVRAILDAGAVGINIEDQSYALKGGSSLEETEFMVRKIQGIRAMTEDYGVRLFINAKTDAIWLSMGGDQEASIKEAIRRANIYGAAGADCVFVPGDLNREVIAKLVHEINYPLNIVAKEVTPSISALRELGVRRLSLGSGPMRAAMGLTKRISEEVLLEGTFSECFNLAVPYPEVQRMFDQR